MTTWTTTSRSDACPARPIFFLVLLPGISAQAQAPLRVPAMPVGSHSSTIGCDLESTLQAVSPVFGDVGAGGPTPDSSLDGLFVACAAVPHWPASGGAVPQ